jgi:hypothetical protein
MLESRACRDLRLCAKLKAHVCLAGPKASQCQLTEAESNVTTADQETMA